MTIAYQYSNDRVDYETALTTMEARVEAIHAENAPELLWFLEHPPLYTSGTSAKKNELLGSMPFPIYEAGRGGQWTYHGPGQRICYVMLDLKSRQMMDLRRYVQLLEQWIIATLAHFGVEGFTREGRIGVWVNQESALSEKQEARSADRASLEPRPCENQQIFAGQKKEAKIAALGIRVRRWVTFHGIALNVHPDLSHYGGIVPCGISEHGVTSLHDLGVKVSMDEVDKVLREEFENVFGKAGESVIPAQAGILSRHTV